MSSAAAPLTSLRRIKSAKSEQLAPTIVIGAALAAGEPAQKAPNGAALNAEQLRWQAEANQELDKLAVLIAENKHSEFVRSLTNTLFSLKVGVDQETWNGIIIPAVRSHRLAALVHECPLTRHSFSRPRGYPGDAGLLDLIYRHESAQAQVDTATLAGRAVFDFTVEVSACEAVRLRRNLLAQKIDQVASDRPGSEMLAVACGHPREAELSEALKNGMVSRFVATDQDVGSLEVVKAYAEEGARNIEAQKLSVRDLIGAKHGLSGFDFVYAAGLYDYLEDRLASRLTRKLFSLLKPGGRLLVANFLTGIWELPYMEAYMDWHLLYRSEEQIRAFASEISEVDTSSVSYFEDSTGCVGYLELVRA